MVGLSIIGRREARVKSWQLGVGNWQLATATDQHPTANKKRPTFKVTATADGFAQQHVKAAPGHRISKLQQRPNRRRCRRGRNISVLSVPSVVQFQCPYSRICFAYGELGLCPGCSGQPLYSVMNVQACGGILRLSGFWRM